MGRQRLSSLTFAPSGLVLMALCRTQSERPLRQGRWGRTRIPRRRRSGEETSCSAPTKTQRHALLSAPPEPPSRAQGTCKSCDDCTKPFDAFLRPSSQERDEEDEVWGEDDDYAQGVRRVGGPTRTRRPLSAPLPSVALIEHT